MVRPLHIALLELKLFLNNRGELAFGVALPILLFALMYGALSGDGEVFTPANVVDLDGGVHARELVARLDSLPEVEVKERTEADANGALARSAILLAVVIPVGFSDAMSAGEPAPLVFRQRGNGGDTGQIVTAIVRGIARDMATDARVRRYTRQALSSSGVAMELIDSQVESQLAALRASPPVAVEVRRPGARLDLPPEGEETSDDDMFSRLLPGLMVMFVMFSVTLAAQALVEDRRTGTLERLMTTRLGVNQLFAGKFLSGVARAMFQTVVMLSLAFAVFRPGGALMFAELLAFTLLAAAAFTAVSLVIGAVARTRNQAAWAAVFFTLLMVVFGGTFFVIAEGSLLDTISKATINAYAIDAMRNIIAGGKGLGQQWLEMAVMVGVAAVGLALARLLFRITPEGR
jgi:ABC-2 type transport system permease protein